MRSNLKLVTTLGAGMTLAILALAACGSDDGDSGGSGGGEATCWPTNPACGLDGVGEECVAWHDNGGSTVLSFRMSQLEVIKPSVLAGEFLQNNVVSHGISLNLPICYIEETVEGFPIAPVTVAIETSEQNGETVFNLTEKIPDMTVAIYLTDEEDSAIILPLHQVLMTEGKISADGNCIGSWKGDELAFDNNCKPDREQKMPWVNGARLTGYIGLEEADTVWIPEMTQTLCVALSGSGASYGEEFSEGEREGLRCLRDGDGKIVAAEKADWCSATDAACSPPDADAFRLEGEFAASAVKVLDSCP